MEAKGRIKIEMAGYVSVNLVDVDFDFVEMEEKPRIEIEMAELSKGAEAGRIKAKNKMAELSKSEGCRSGPDWSKKIVAARTVAEL